MSSNRPRPERNAEILRAYALGRTVASLSEEHGVNQSRIRQIIAAHRAKQGPVDRAEQINSATDLLDRLIEKAAELVELEGAPVTSGKDGRVVIDPERRGPHGEPVYVRDYAGRLAAIDRVRTLLERKAKLLGLDAPARTEVESDVKINYVINGLEPGALT